MAENVAHFAVKSIGLSRVHGRKPCTLLEAARHNLREIQAEQGATGRIDPRRTHSNTVLHGPRAAAEVQTQAVALLAAANINADKLRRDHCQAIEAVFSLPPYAAIPNPAVYFAHCLQWLAADLRLPVLSAVVHRDESAFHLHVLLLPLEEGVHVGSAPIGREALKRLRANFFAKVAGPAGLKRMGAKMQGAFKQWAVAAVLCRCEALGLPEANGPLWPVLVAAIQRDPTAAAQALAIDQKSIAPATAQPQAYPIGIEANPIGIEKEGQKCQSLSCVGFAAKTPPVTSLAPAPAPQPPAPMPTCSAAPVAPAPAPAHVESVRVRDSEYSAQQFDPDTGEFIRLPAPAPKRRDMADSLVQAALARRAAAQPTRTTPP